MEIKHDSSNSSKITLKGYNAGTMDLVASRVSYACDAYHDLFTFWGMQNSSVEVTFLSARWNPKLRIDGFYELDALPTRDQEFVEEYGHMEAYFIIRGGSIILRNYQRKEVAHPVPENRFLHLIRQDGRWYTFNLEDGKFRPELRR